MSDTFARLLAATRIDIDNLRDAAHEHTITSNELTARLDEPTAHLERLAAEEAELARRLEAVRLEMVQVRKAYDDLTGERDRHRKEAEANAAAAEYYETKTLPDMERMLKESSPGEALASAGLPGSPEAIRDAEARAAGEDPMPFNVAEASPDTVAAITSGTPVAGELVATSGPTTTGPIDPAITLPDTGLAPPPLPPAEPSDQPRHAKPKKNIEWSGAFKAITGRIGEQGGVA